MKELSRLVIRRSMSKRRNDDDAVKTLELPVVLGKFLKCEENKWRNFKLIKSVKMYGL